MTFKVSCFNHLLFDAHCKLSIRVLASYVDPRNTHVHDSLKVYAHDFELFA